MEKLRRAVIEIAYTQDQAKLSALHRSIIPVLSLASSVYKLALSLRRYLYRINFFSKHRLPVPVISVGNLTWGGNGKTPMVEFIARWLADSGISPLILTRGYAGGDEARMLRRRLLGTPAKIGVGADRAATAAAFFEQYGYVDPVNCLLRRMLPDQKLGLKNNLGKIGAVVLDDGMQHWSLHRDLEIVMVNSLTTWGNHRLLPLGPLREPLTALQRADIVLIHHANLVSNQNLKDIESVMRGVKESLPIFFTSMCPLCFFSIGNINSKVPLDVVKDMIVLCISAIGSANAFVLGVKKMGASHVDQLDFSDHHLFQAKDVDMIRMKVREMEDKFGSKPVVVITEKDYDRDPDMLWPLSPFEVLVLCSELRIIPYGGRTKDSFKKLSKELLEKYVKVSYEGCRAAPVSQMNQTAPGKFSLSIWS